MMLLALVLMQAPSAGVGPPTPLSGIDLRCGSYCLFVCMRALGADSLTFSELERELGQPTSKGYSMGQLADVARKHGFHCLGVVTSAEHLRARNRPFACIAQIDEAHFVAIANIQDDKARLFDPPRTYDLPLDTLRNRWNGAALLISTGSLLAEEDLTQQPTALLPAVVSCILGVIAVVIVASIYRRRLTR